MFLIRAVFRLPKITVWGCYSFNNEISALNDEYAKVSCSRITEYYLLLLAWWVLRQQGCRTFLIVMHWFLLSWLVVLLFGANFTLNKQILYQFISSGFWLGPYQFSRVILPLA